MSECICFTMAFRPEERMPPTENFSRLSPPQATLFKDLWDGCPVDLPHRGWAIHRIESATVGPVIAINEMMVNAWGVPFPLKQLVISSTGNIMVMVLNQIIDVSMIAVVPPKTITELQSALNYFNRVECEYTA